MSSAPVDQGSVATVLVSHGGARWLPTVLEGLQDQSRLPDHVVAVDTGSKDDSAARLTTAIGPDRVLITGRQTSFPEAVDLALDRLRELGDAPTWIWLLHDDATPAPTALAELLAAAAAHPEADVLGPKLREWPSLRRLLELGVTISATGRRETGLERAEYDQGQHDDVRRVLAVNTAGMLVRLDVLEELGGFDRQLPIFGNDIDFGWRAAAAGRTTLVIPQAVVFHAEAAHRGARRTPLTGRHTHYQERRAALYTLLVNGRARSLPFRVARLAVGTVVRVLGFLLVRSLGEALDELAALGWVLGRPRLLLAARRSRRALASADQHTQATVRSLLAPWWLPYRHGLDVVSDLAAAATNQASDVAERRRAAALEQAAAEAAAAPSPSRVHTGPAVVRARRVDDDDEELPEPDSGLLTRFLTSPVAVGAAVFVVAVLAGTRQAWGSVSGGALAAAPAGAADWWRLYAEHWHPLGLGTDAPAPAYVAPLAVLATLLGGSPAAAVTAVLVLAVPVALWGAWRLVRVVGRFLHPAGMPRWLVAAAAATYALVPVVSGAWGAGRLGVVVVSALLPWLVHAALGFADPEADRRWRAAWRTGLLLALVTAFGPPLLPFVALLTVLLLVLGLVANRSLVLDRSVSGPPLVALGVVPVLLAPWWLPMVLDGRAGGLLIDTGRLPPAVVDAVDLLLGRVDAAGAPEWLGWPILAAALLALVPRASRMVALACWTASLAAAATAALVSLPTVAVLGGEVRPGGAALVPVVQGAFVVAGAAGGMALLLALRGAVSTWVHRLAVLPALVALAVPIVGAAWFAGGGHGDLGDTADSDIPAYMSQSSRLGPEHGVLVLRGDVGTGLRYQVLRGDGDTVGEDEVLAMTDADTAFADGLRSLVSRPTPAAVTALAARGIEYVVLPAPADGRVAAQLDATAGLSQASAEDRATRAWLVDEPAPADALDGPGSWLRVALLVLQGLALLVVGVLCGPTWRERR